jgi:hypothetical protein
MKTNSILILLFLVVAITLIFITGCSEKRIEYVPTYQPQHPVTTTPKQALISELTESQVKLMLIEKLQNLATSPQAKEYVAIVLKGDRYYAAYFENENAWEVGISHDEDSLEMLQKASWFQVEDVDYFAETHWSIHSSTHWNLFADFRLVETGSLVETDIAQLNTTGVLK